MKKITLVALVAALMLMNACKKEDLVNQRATDKQLKMDLPPDTTGRGDQGGPKQPPH